MKQITKMFGACVAAAVSLSAAAAHAQHGQTAPQVEGRPAIAPFGMEVAGSFRQMTHKGDTAGKISLAALNTKAGSYGLGAMAGLRGEVMLWDGRLLVSRGESATGQAEMPRAGDEAALFVSAHVPKWIELPLTRDMRQKEFESFVVEMARKNGLAADQAFPFAVRGKFPGMLWHVVTGAASDKSPEQDKAGHKPVHEGKRLFDQTGVSGLMLGFYSGAALEGVISHPGERFHLHYAAADWSAAGHVEAYTVSQGATLMLPAP